MKKIKHKKLLIALGVIVLILTGVCIYMFTGSSETNATKEISKGDKDTKSIIVYMSRSGVITKEPDKDADAVSSASLNTSDGVTDDAARQLQKITGADYYQIKTATRYRDTYWGTAGRAFFEEKLNTRPDLAAKPDSLDKYDVIFVGFPVWWYNPPMAIGSFLESYNLEGKTVIPFCTSTETKMDECMDYIKDVSGKAKVLKGYRFSKSSDEDVKNWLKEIKYY